MRFGVIIYWEDLVAAAVASLPGTADSSGYLSQGGLSCVKSRSTISGAGRVHTLTDTLVVGVLIQGPGTASSHNQGLGSIIVLELRDVTICILFTTDEVLVQVDVESVSLPCIRSTGESCTGGNIVKL